MIACIICKSPIRNYTLQSYIKSENRESIRQLLDFKTSLSSLVAILKRFLDLRALVKKTLIDRKLNSLLSEAECVALAAIVRALKPVGWALRNFVVEM